MNKCIFAGNLVRDPELKDTPNSKVVNFTIAVNNPRKKKGEADKDTVFLDMVAWAEGAETINKYFKKGSFITVEASVQQDTYEEKDTGKTRRATKYRVNQFWFPPKSGNLRTENEGEAVAAGADAGSSSPDVPF